jgi:hypothetical protein
MKTPQVKPDWPTAIYAGAWKAPIVPSFDNCKKCGDLFIGLVTDDNCRKCSG